MSLNKFSIFMQVLSIKRKHYAKTNHFSRHKLFSTLYVLQEHKLIITINPRRK
jgi:hypothetical protein